MTVDVTGTLNRAVHIAGVGMGLPLHLASQLLVADQPPTPDQIRAIRRRRFALIDADLAHARAGYYPTRLVFDRAALRDPVAWPLALRDFFSARFRRASGSWRLSPELARDYPAYYRRRFHWQKDGYLSRRSARRYDLGVELLFLGAADTMRRQVIPPLLKTLPDDARILDVGCGTGRTLDQLAAARPRARLTGVDLSPYYIAEARRRCPHPHLSLLVHDGASLPFPDHSFDGVTSTFLFHELPPGVRRQVVAEMVRVCRPGGPIVLEDAAQTSDGADLGPLLHAFHQSLHEPFFASHLDDPLEGLLAAQGVTSIEVTPCYVAKVVSGRTPTR